ncbi:MAG: beta-ketoacyl-ACP synthase 3 [Planctomycetota bacterium]
MSSLRDSLDPPRPVPSASIPDRPGGGNSGGTRGEDSGSGGPTVERMMPLYRAMRATRTTNELEAELTKAGDVFFHLPCAGHESVAAWAGAMRPEDWAHTHYRDHALWLARGFTPRALLDTALSNATSYSAGRQMVGFMASAELNMPSTVVPVGNHTTQAVGIAAHLEEQRLKAADSTSEDPVVLCGMGDGSTQQGEVLEAIAEAVRRHLPVLFYVMDNGYAISTPTARQTFFHRPDGPAESFYGLPIHRFDGRDVAADLPRLDALVDEVRATRGPAIAVMRVDRLTSHTNADDHRVYRPAETIEHLGATADPLVNLRRSLLDAGVAEAELDAIDDELAVSIRRDAELARRVPDPETCYDASRPLPPELAYDAPEYRGTPPGSDNATSNGRSTSAPESGTKNSGGSGGGLMMIEAMRGVLRHRLDTDERVVLLGEDIEDPKGDVFGVTRGLSTAFPGRVQNTALSESTIIGGAIGRAMAGGRPVGFIQFADFLPNGVSQIISELGSIHWRSGGQFDCPVILMVTCGAYRPGLGPFHAHTHEALLAHIPGVDVVMPSTAGDAAGLLNAAFTSGRPTVFLYPKVCLNDRALTTSPDVDRHLIPLGKARRETQGDSLTLVGWGSVMPILRDVAAELHRQTDRSVELLDLRSISPWDRKAVAESAARTRRLLVVHEDNLTAGFGAEIVAAASEDVPHLDRADAEPLRVKRLTRPDTYAPTNYANQLDILPSFRGTLAAACDLLGLAVTFGDEESVPAAVAADAGDVEVIEAQGSAPTDQAVTVSAWLVKPGESVKGGQVIAELEADKAVFEYAAPYDAVVAELLIGEGEQVDVGTPMLKLAKPPPEAATVQNSRGDDPLDAPIVKRVSREDRGTPVIAIPDQDATPTSGGGTKTSGVKPVRVGGRTVRVYLSPVHYAEGRDRLTNADLVRRFPNVTSDDIVKRTGIESRPYCAHDQNALSLAVDAATKALAAEGLTVADLTGIVCHTTTPPLNTPSMACMVLQALDPDAKHELMVYDVNAACSGWLYALDAAHNTIQHNPDSAVLVVTTECLSRVVNPDDFGTAILFGDAATATVARGSVEQPHADAEPPSGEASGIPTGSMILSQPVLAGKTDAAGSLTVGFEGRGHITMDGKKVFTEAVRAMTKMTNQAFERSGAPLDDLDWLVPHQANQRIFEAARTRLKIPEEKIVNLIRHHGNTSSSSIPLSIAKSGDKFRGGNIVGVCAFGGGFTFGAAILEIV